MSALNSIEYNPEASIECAPNTHGKAIRRMTIYTQEKVTEIFFQCVEGAWIPFKRLVHSIH